MPFKDPEKRRAYMANYEPAYREENADRVRARKAAWFQANKDRLKALWATNDRNRRKAQAAAAASGALAALAENLTVPNDEPETPSSHE
ncbi:MAG: hypothetical protein ACOYMN_25500 [Roseimicrobium sp.]